MGNPIINRTVAVPAGLTGERLPAIGRFIKIVSISQASVLLGFDQETPERVYADDVLEGGLRGFKSLRFVADVAPCTVVVQISQYHLSSSGTINGQAMLVQLVAAAASLANIDTDLERLKPGTARSGGQSAAIAQTGNAGTSILAATATRKKGWIQADDGNTGNVWLGNADTVTEANSFFELLPGATYVVEDTVAIYAVSANGTEKVRYHETT